MHVLVTYGSKYGGTAEIARTIGETLRSAGLETDVLSASDVTDVEAYDAVVIGGALYANRWQRDAKRFVRHHVEDLKSRPVWFFSSGPLDDSATLGDIPPTLPVQKLMSVVGVRAHKTFGGRLLPDTRGVVAGALAKEHAGDFRDEASIERWAREVASDLALLPAPAPRPPATAAYVRPPSPFVFVLSACALLGAAVASIATLLFKSTFPEPFPPPPFNAVLAEARGWSAVTLFVVVPLGVAAVVASASELDALKPRLLWAGIMAYLLYTYLEFAVGPPFTALYLVYITTFACALVALIAIVASIEVRRLKKAFSQRAPRRATAAFALILAFGLSAAWLQDIVTRTLGGDFGWPAGEAAVAHVVRALDLGLQVPLCTAAGLLMLRRRASGYLVMSILLVMSTCMAAALTAMVGTSAFVSGQSVLSAFPFLIILLVSVALTIALFRAALSNPGTTRRRIEPMRASDVPV